jgi:hypothetical protein
VALILKRDCTAQDLFGNKVLVIRNRGTFLPSPLAPHASVTLHPYSILRARSDEDWNEGMDDFAQDRINVTAMLKD